MYIDIGISVDPEDVTICKGENATFNCGYFFINFPDTVVFIPQWIITRNVTMRLTMDNIVNDINDLLQWIVIGDDTNTTRLLVGPVDERFVGRTTFQCEIPVKPTPQSHIATLTVIG